MPMSRSPAFYIAMQRLSTIFARTLTEVGDVFGELAVIAEDERKREGLETAPQARRLEVGGPLAVASAEEKLAGAAPPPPPRIESSALETTPDPSEAAQTEQAIEVSAQTHSPTSAPQPVEAPPPIPAAEPPAPAAPREDLIPLEMAARENQMSPATIYKMVKKSLVRVQKPFGRQPFVSRLELSRAIASGQVQLRRSRPPAEGQLTPMQAAAELKLSSQAFYRLVQSGEFKGVVYKGRRFGVPIEAVEAFKRAKGIVLEPAAPLPAPAPAAHVVSLGEKVDVVAATSATAIAVPVAQPSLPPPPPLPRDLHERLSLMLTNVEEEINHLQTYLDTMGGDQRAQQISIWAGTIRKIAAESADIQSSSGRADLRAKIWRFTDALRTLADRYQVWVNALIAEWDIEDWNLYIKACGKPLATLTPVEAEVIVEGNLRAMVLRPRQVTAEHAEKHLAIGAAVLAEDNALLMRAKRMFAKLTSPPVEEEEPVERELPEGVVKLTRGKRLLIVGGQRDSEAYKEKYMEQLELASCEWVTHEIGKGHAAVTRVRGRIDPKNYDLMLYLARFTGHEMTKLLSLAKANGLPVVMLAKGYGLSGVVKAISDQYSGGPKVTNGVHKGRKGQDARRAHA